MSNSGNEATNLHYTFGRISGYKEVSQMLPSLRKFNQSEVAQERKKIIDFFDHYGERATIDAFKVDRKLIHVWKKRLKLGKQKPSALVPNSTKPKRTRQMMTDQRIIDFIKGQREDHYRLGKEKIKVWISSKLQNQNQS